MDLFPTITEWHWETMSRVWWLYLRAGWLQFLTAIPCLQNLNQVSTGLQVGGEDAVSILSSGQSPAMQEWDWLAPVAQQVPAGQGTGQQRAEPKQSLCGGIKCTQSYSERADQH